MTEGVAAPMSCDGWLSGCLQVLTVGGSSPHVDLFTNLSYRAFSLSF